jgi:anti-sigma regulatory factor (Ser/Thr protein kinase)
MPQLCLPVADSSQIGDVRRQATRLAELTGLSESQNGAVSIVATELATNLSRYATEGRVLLQALPSGSGEFVEILAVDRGPGMDVDRCVRDGYSTGGTSGNGLGAVTRLSDEFDAYSTPTGGSVVMARLGPRPKRAAVNVSGFRWGAISIAAPNESVCGDAWCVAERDGEVAVMVADGLGHGIHAAEAAGRAAAVFPQHRFAGPVSFCEASHRALSGSRGAAVALAHVGGGTVRFAGVGNIAGALVTPGGIGRGLMCQNGTVGFQMRPVKQLDYPWPEQGCLVMHSDGLTARWSLAAYPGLQRRHPALIAAVLYRDSVRGRDDATVVVVAERAKP